MRAQFTQRVFMPKYPTVRREFMPLTGSKLSLNLEGPEWMIWTSVFNIGFSVKNIMLLIP